MRGTKTIFHRTESEHMTISGPTEKLLGTLDSQFDYYIRRRLISIYGRLPIIKHLRAIERTLAEQHKSLKEIENATQRMMMARLDSYVHQLLKEQRYSNPKRLNRYEMQVFSQGGEDGVISEIFRRLGLEGQTFVEIGVGDGLENNTTFLLLQGWSGWWIDGDKKNIKNICHHFQSVIEEK